MRLQAFLNLPDGRLSGISTGAIFCEELVWDAWGGPASAKLRVPQSRMKLADWAACLGWGVQVVDESGLPLWWGWLRQASQQQGRFRSYYDLAELANRVCVTYQNAGQDELLVTAWAEDPASIAAFGRKDKLVNGGWLSDAAAVSLRDRILAEGAWPALQTLPFGARGMGNEVTLEAEGWLERLSWRVGAVAASRLGHMPAQQGVQPVGAALNATKAAQSLIAWAEDRPMNVRLRARRVGSPSDQLVGQIVADYSGTPGSMPLAQGSLPAAGLEAESYRWEEITLNPLGNLVPGQRYWLIAARSGSPDALNYCQVGVDEALGFDGGAMRLWDQGASSWAAREPRANLLFQIEASRTVAQQMAALMSEAEDLFNGWVLEANGALAYPVADSPLLLAMARLRQLAGTGGDGQAWFAAVSAERFLRVYPAPRQQPAVVTVNDDGLLQHQAGFTWQGPPPVGQWVGTKDGGMFLLKRARWDAMRGLWEWSTK